MITSNARAEFTTILYSEHGAARRAHCTLIAHANLIYIQ
jgi:hypothetical protein